MDIGDKFGKLTITRIYRSGRGFRVDAVCRCGKVVSDTSSEFKRKRRGSCRRRECIGSGGRRVNYHGYVVIRVDAQDVLEHRHVVQELLGRKLLASEVVHHINGDKQDNRIENLAVVDEDEHRRLHADLFRELIRLRKENEDLRKRIEGRALNASGNKMA